MRADGFGEVAARSEVDGVGSGVVDVVGGRRAPSFGIAVVGGVRDLRHVGLPWGGRRRSGIGEGGAAEAVEAAGRNKARDPRSAGLPRWCGRGCRPRVRKCVCRPCPLYCQSGHQRSVRRADEESMSNLGFNSGEETWAAHRCAGHVRSKVAERKGGPQGVDNGESHKRHRFRTRGRAKIGVRRWGKADGALRRAEKPRRTSTPHMYVSQTSSNTGAIRAHSRGSAPSEKASRSHPSITFLISDNAALASATFIPKIGRAHV